MKNIIKTTAYSAVALSSVAFTFATATSDPFGKWNAKKFTWTWDDWSTTLMQMLENILGFILTFTWIIAVGFAIYWGFKVMTAGWDDEKAKKGKTTLIQALIGIFVVLVASTLVGWIFTEADTLNSSTYISNIV